MSWRKIPFCLCVLYEFEGLKVIAFTELIVSVSIAVIHYNPCLAIDALANPYSFYCFLRLVYVPLQLCPLAFPDDAVRDSDVAW